MGLPTSRMATAAEDLSGGEKARLLLGLATFHEPHMLILDEPTNHLDIDARETLIQALNTYEGAVIVISHDRHLIEASADRLWLVAGGTVAPYDGDLDEYRKLVQQGPAAVSAANGGQRNGGDRRSAQERRREAAERRAKLAPLRKQVQAAEKDLARLNKKVEQLERTLGEGALFNDQPAKAAQLAKERADTIASIAKTEERWLELSAELEAGKVQAN